MIYRLKIFRVVYEEKGFSIAAKRLGLTQSAVSQQIRALEDEFGVRLFAKENRSSPTTAGDYLYKEAGKLLGTYGDIKNKIVNLEKIVKGSVEFGMIDVAAIALLPKILKKFKQKYPAVELQAVVKPSGELLMMVEDYRLEFCIAVSHDVDAKFVKRGIFKDSIVAVVNKKSPLAGKKEITIEELRGEPLILYPLASHSRRLVEYFFKKHDIMPTIAMEMHYPAAILSLVAQGMGTGLMSELSTREEKLKGQKIIPVRELNGAREIACIYLKERVLSPQTIALINMVVC